MEFSRLLSFAGPVVRKADIREFSDNVIGVDGDAFIKSVFNSIPTFSLEISFDEKLLELLVSSVDVFSAFKIKPFFVFNGATVPYKSQKLELAKKQRKEILDEAEKAKAEGLTNKAIGLYRNGFEISFELITNFRKNLIDKGIDSIFAPFDAEAELTFLNASGFVSAICTENPRILIYNPKLVLLNFTFIKNPRNTEVLEVKSDDMLAFYEITKDRFAQACCLAGELYSLPEIGWNFAELQEMYKSKTPFQEIIDAMKKVNPNLPDFYQAQVIKEVKTVFHQIVYDPKTQTMTTLNPCQEPLPKNYVKDDLMKVVSGAVDPSTIQQSTNFLTWNSSAETSPKKKSPKRTLSPSSMKNCQSILSFFHPKE